MKYNPWRHAEQERVAVITHPLAPGLNGLWIPAQRTILLAPNLTGAMERCVLAHELAHATLGHEHARGPAATRQEIAADRLAARWLIDEDAVLTAAASTDDAGRIALDLGVTPQLLRLWLRDTVRPQMRIAV